MEEFLMNDQEPDVSPTPELKESKEPVKKGRAKKYLDEIKKLQEEKEQVQDKLLRKIAEFDNYKKRTERDFLERIQNANEQLVTQLLPVLDDMERFLEHAPETNEEDTMFSAAELIVKKIASILEKTGLKSFSSIGEDFNPEMHDALLQKESDTYSSGKIIEEHVKGYTLNGKVIRHAQVIVAK
jgi:molecular chaperone GrpE